jgi:hypothetical protein
MSCESLGEQAESALSGRNFGTAKQASTVGGGVTPPTLRKWVRAGLVRAVRVGNGPYRYDLDSVAAMVVEYPCPDPDVDERIRELIEAAPELTPRQVNKIRLLLQTAPQRDAS